MCITNNLISPASFPSSSLSTSPFSTRTRPHFILPLLAPSSAPQTHYSIAWGNVNLFDFNNRLRNDKISLALWPIAQGFEELLNPIGIPG